MNVEHTVTPGGDALVPAYDFWTCRTCNWNSLDPENCTPDMTARNVAQGAAAAPREDIGWADSFAKSVNKHFPVHKKHPNAKNYPHKTNQKFRVV
jgi:hypothetical protein